MNATLKSTGSLGARLGAAGLALSMALGCVLAPTQAMAGPKHRVAATHVSHQQAQTRDDVRDLAQLQLTIKQWERATRTHNRHMERQADARLSAWVHAEMAENRVEVQEARQEAMRSRNELRHSRKMAVMYGASSAQQQEVARNKVEARDDGQDLMEKRRDGSRTIAIAMELNQMQPAFRNGNATHRMYQQKAALLAELKAIAVAEIGEDREELVEDGYHPPPRPRSVT